MEEIKPLDQLCKIDERHVLLGYVTGEVLSLEKIYAVVAEISINSEAPEAVRNQFNVARNMTIYNYFLYSLAPKFI